MGSYNIMCQRAEQPANVHNWKEKSDKTTDKYLHWLKKHSQ